MCWMHTASSHTDSRSAQPMKIPMETNDLRDKRGCYGHVLLLSSAFRRSGTRVFSYRCALFCTLEFLNLLLFNLLRTLSQKHRGWGYLSQLLHVNYLMLGWGPWPQSRNMPMQVAAQKEVRL